MATNSYATGVSPNGTGCEIADSATYKTAQVEAFVVLNGDNSQDWVNSGEQSPGVIVGYMPTGSADTVSRWGLTWSYYDLDGPIHALRNAAPDPVKFFGGQAYRRSKTDDYTIWDLSTNDQSLYVDVNHPLVVNPNYPASGGSITYPSSQVLMVGNNRAYNNSYRGRFRAVILYGTARSDRQSISAYLKSSSSLNLPGIPWTFSRRIYVDAGFHINLSW